MFFPLATVSSHSLGARVTGGGWFGKGKKKDYTRQKAHTSEKNSFKTWLQVKTCPSWALVIPLDLHRDFPFPTFYVTALSSLASWGGDFGLWEALQSLLPVWWAEKMCFLKFSWRVYKKIILILGDINTSVPSPQLVSCKRQGTFWDESGRQKREDTVCFLILSPHTANSPLAPVCCLNLHHISKFLVTD